MNGPQATGRGRENGDKNGTDGVLAFTYRLGTKARYFGFFL